MQSLIKLTLIMTLGIAMLAADVSADRTRLKKPSEKSSDSKPTVVYENPFMATGFLTVGKLTGKITDYVDEMKNQILYGFGGGLEYYFRPNIGVAGEVRLLWAKPHPDVSVSATDLRLGLIYRFKPLAERTVYLKFGVGRTNGSWEAESRTRTSLRGAIGLLDFGSGRIHTRLELSYTGLLYPTGEDGYFGYNAPWDINYIALDIGMGIPL